MAKETEAQRIRREFSKRLNELLDAVGVPPKDRGRQVWFAKAIGVTQNGARKWLEGIGIPRPPYQHRIVEKYGCRIEWLMFGLGPMFERNNIDALRERIEKAVADARVKLNPRQRARLIERLYSSLSSNASG